MKSIGREVREKCFTALKTNIFLYDADRLNPRGWRPGFGSPFKLELNVDRAVIRDLVMPDCPGWGNDPVEDAIRAHPPKGPPGLLK